MALSPSTSYEMPYDIDAANQKSPKNTYDPLLDRYTLLDTTLLSHGYPSIVTFSFPRSLSSLYHILESLYEQHPSFLFPDNIDHASRILARDIHAIGSFRHTTSGRSGRIAVLSNPNRGIDTNIRSRTCGGI